MDSLSFRDFLALCEADSAPPEGSGSSPPPPGGKTKSSKPMNKIAATGWFFDMTPEEMADAMSKNPQFGGDSEIDGIIRPQTMYRMNPETGRFEIMSGDDSGDAMFDDKDIIKGWREKKLVKGKDGGIRRIKGRHGHRGNMSVPDQGDLYFKGVQGQAGGMGGPMGAPM